MSPEQVKSLIDAGPLTIALVSIGFVAWACAKIAVAKWAHPPKITIDERRGEILTRGFEDRFNKHAERWHEVATVVPKVDQLTGRVRLLEMQYEDHLKESSVHTVQLTDLRIQVAGLAGKVDGTREKIESLCEQVDKNDQAMGDRVARIEDGVGEIRKALMDGKAKS